MPTVYALSTAHADGVGEVIAAATTNAESTAINEISARPNPVPGWKTGRWYSVQAVFPGTWTGASTLVTNEIYASPVFVPVATAIDQVGIRIDTGVAASTVRLMAFAEGSDGHPGARLFDWGTVSGAATGDMAISISSTLPAGIVWLACIPSAACVVGTFATPNASLTGAPYQAWNDCSPHRPNGSTTAPNPFGTTSIAYLADAYVRLAVRAT